MFDATGSLIGTVWGATGTANYCSNANGNAKYYYTRFSEQYKNFTYYDPNQLQWINYLDPTGVIGSAATSIACGSHCMSSGPALATCTANGGSGGTTTVACDGLPESILINGLDGVPVLCNPYQITIGNNLWFSLPNTTSTNYHNMYSGVYQYPTFGGNYTGVWGNANKDYGFGGFSSKCWTSACADFGICPGCEYWYGAYNIYIEDLDFNNKLVPGNSWNRTFPFDSYAAFNWDGSHCSTWMWGLQTITFPISAIPGANLQPGHFYVIGIQTTNELPHGTTYKTSSRLVYIMPDGGGTAGDYSSKNTTIGDAANAWDARNVFAEHNIVLDETTVLSNVKAVAAGNCIHVVKDAAGKTDLKGGHYYIATTSPCNRSFRTSDPTKPDRGGKTPSDTYLTESAASSFDAPKHTYYQYKATTDKPDVTNGSFVIYPNPANDNVIAEFKGDVPDAGSTLTVSIYNSWGQKIKNETVNLLDRYVSLNVEDLDPGIYTFLIIQGNKSWKSKIVKQ